MPVRAVIFDLDDTLILEAAVARASMRAAASVVPALDPERAEGVVLATARRTWRAGPHYALCRELGIASWEGLWATFEGSHPRLLGLREWAPTYRRQVWASTLAELGIDDPALASAAAEAYVEAQRAGHPLLDGAGAVVRALAERVVLGLLTNGPPDIQRLKLERTGLRECFAAVGISGERGVGKPDRAAFAGIVDELGVRPGEAVMVGDSWERDVRGALGAGMSAVWIANGRRWPEQVAGVRRITRLGDLTGPWELLERPAADPG